MTAENCNTNESSPWEPFSPYFERHRETGVFRLVGSTLVSKVEIPKKAAAPVTPQNSDILGEINPIFKNFNGHLKGEGARIATFGEWWSDARLYSNGGLYSIRTTVGPIRGHMIIPQCALLLTDPRDTLLATQSRRDFFEGIQLRIVKPSSRNLQDFHDAARAQYDELMHRVDRIINAQEISKDKILQNLRQEIID